LPQGASALRARRSLRHAHPLFLMLRRPPSSTLCPTRRSSDIGHITPEAFVGGPIALIENGDPISIDAEKREITLGISKKELEDRRKNWRQPKPNHTRGVLAKYAKLVSSASEGAVTDGNL
ncbi:MAG: dihydroxy-acid dehydratase, partial [Verrucomicrobiae bacterium]|nr:dihydroxy-acid dehydratase [Verrucomicrobiae bacterium]